MPAKVALITGATGQDGAYLAELLLEHAKSIRTLTMVVAPRDFEACLPFDAEFLERGAFVDYVIEKRNPWRLYATGLSTRFFGDAWSLLTDREFRASLELDPWGSMPLHQKIDHMPPPKFDSRCFDALAALERRAAKHAVRLVVVHFPVNPHWQARFDPDRSITRKFRERVQRSLIHPSTQIIETDSLAVPTEDFADAIHLVWPATVPFSRFVADRLELN